MVKRFGLLKSVIWVFMFFIGLIFLFPVFFVGSIIEEIRGRKLVEKEKSEKMSLHDFVAMVKEEASR